MKFYNKIMQDVSKWQKTANDIETMDTPAIRLWQAKQVKPFMEESTELVDADTKEKHIDAVFDTMWTSLNFGVYMEDEFIASLDSDFNQVTGRQTTEQVKYVAEKGRIHSTVNFAALRVKEVLQIAARDGYDVEKMWEIGSTSNWAKFATTQEDVDASIQYYADKGVKCVSNKRGDCYVITVDGEQHDNGGKYYFDGKILKAGKVVDGEFMPWAEPVWDEAFTD
jgi:hypothetical protein